VFLAAGRFWDKAKNLRLLELVAGDLPWPLRVAGETADAAQPGGSIEFLGSLSRAEFARELTRSAVFVHPALYEPFGLSVLEAAASGCALVLADIPSLREIWGDSALYVDPRDAGGLRSACQSLASDEPRRRWLAERAQRRSRLYSLDAMTQGYLRVYHELLSASSRPSGFSARSLTQLEPATASRT
jgi:glycosyltransferase involved in cell wall biosynthesis